MTVQLKKSEKEKKHPKEIELRAKMNGTENKEGSKPKAGSQGNLRLCSVFTHLVVSSFFIPDSREFPFLQAQVRIYSSLVTFLSSISWCLYWEFFSY